MHAGAWPDQASLCRRARGLAGHSFFPGAHTIPSQSNSMASRQQEPLLLVSYGAPVSYGTPGGEPRRLCPVLPRPEARRMHGRIYLLFTSALFLGLAAYLLTQSRALLRAAEVASQSLWRPGSDMCAAYAARCQEDKDPKGCVFGCAFPMLSICVPALLAQPSSACLPACFARRCCFPTYPRLIKDRLSLAALGTWCWQ